MTLFLGEFMASRAEADRLRGLLLDAWQYVVDVAVHPDAGEKKAAAARALSARIKRELVK